MNDVWKTQNKELVQPMNIMELWKVDKIPPRKTNAKTYWQMKSKDWVNIVAVTKESRRLVLAEQYRHGIEQTSLEVPGGLVDDNEDAAAAAFRELGEETGFVPEKPLELLGSTSPNPAHFNNQAHTYLADGVLRGEQKLQGNEAIEVKLFSLEQVNEMISNGSISHSLTIAAIYWYEKYLLDQPA